MQIHKKPANAVTASIATEMERAKGKLTDYEKRLQDLTLNIKSVFS